MLDVNKETVRFIIDKAHEFQMLGESGGSELLQMAGDKIAVNDERQTSLPDVWAGGDCVAVSEDLTVAAVQDGKLAAEAINSFLRG